MTASPDMECRRRIGARRDSSSAEFRDAILFAVEIYRSARKRGVDDADIVHAVEHALVVADDEDERKVLYLGPDRAGNVLEVVAVVRDDDTEIVIHAMAMTPQYRSMLPATGDDDG